MIVTKYPSLSSFCEQFLQQLICSMLVLQGIGNQDSETADEAAD